MDTRNGRCLISSFTGLRTNKVLVAPDVASPMHVDRNALEAEPGQTQHSACSALDGIGLTSMVYNLEPTLGFFFSSFRPFCIVIISQNISVYL